MKTIKKIMNRSDLISEYQLAVQDVLDNSARPNKMNILKEIIYNFDNLVLSMFDVARLIGFEETDEDFYYIFRGRLGKEYGSSCVGGFYSMEGHLHPEDYDNLDRIAKLNQM